LTCNTGVPAASYQPHATVCGVGNSVYDFPTGGDDQSRLAVRPALGAAGDPTDDGV
jgi:hypothetical protein